MAFLDRIEPGPGQESVWDYPRPPRLERVDHHVVVEFHGVTIVDTTRAIRILETSQPPAYYCPTDDVSMQHLVPTPSRTFCEWKGQASYWTVDVDGRRSEDAAWSYPAPIRDFAEIRDHLAFYPKRVDACYVDDELVQSNDGDFYGGWITSNIVGPFKGALGTFHW